MVACIVGLSSYNRSVWDASVSRPPGIAPNLQLAAFFFESRCLSLSRAVCASCRRGVGTWPGALRRASVNLDTVDLRRVRGAHVLRGRGSERQPSSDHRRAARTPGSPSIQHAPDIHHWALGSDRMRSSSRQATGAVPAGGAALKRELDEGGRLWRPIRVVLRQCAARRFSSGVDDGLGLSVRQAPPPRHQARLLLLRLALRFLFPPPRLPAPPS